MNVRGVVFFALLSASAHAEAPAPLVIAESPGPGQVTARVAVGCVPPSCPSDSTVQILPNLFGLRASETAIDGRDPKAAVGLVSESVSYLQDPKAGVNARLSHFALLGGGRSGLEGGLGVSLAGGLLVPVGADHGPFSRLGLRAQMLGNDVLWTSLVELPELELGYQLLRRTLHLELAARGGAVLVGRYNPDGARRPLGSAFEYGGLVATRVGAVDFDLEWTRIEARGSDPGTPVDVLSALLCGGANYFGVCFDARLYAGDVREAGRVRERTSAFIGLSLGAFVRDAPAPK